ncbi:MAG: hypothetical protein AAF462_04705 [Thermodesulfobacteriota bacterium]
MTLHKTLTRNKIYIPLVIILFALPFFTENLYAQKVDSDQKTTSEQNNDEEIKKEDKSDSNESTNINSEDSNNDDDEQEPGPSKEDQGAIGRTHRFFSESVLGVTNKLDTFWGDDRSLEEANRSRIWVRLDFDIEQRQGFDFIPTVRANIRVPKTKNRLRIFFNGDEGDQDELEQDIQDNDETGTLFLRYFLFNSPWQSLGVDTGIRIRSSGVAWFAGLRARIYRTYGKWGFRLTDNFRWFTDRQFTNKTRFDIERVIFKDRSFFRSSTFGNWFQRKKGYFIEQNFQLFHKLAERTGIVLQWRTIGETRIDEFFKETRVRLRLRQNIRWRWLFGEIAPSIFWREKYDWDTLVGVRFRIEVHFGNLSRLKFF